MRGAQTPRMAPGPVRMDAAAMIQQSTARKARRRQGGAAARGGGGGGNGGGGGEGVATFSASLFDSTSQPTLQPVMPNHKAGRVKVGIRCRPPFEDEVPADGRAFRPCVNCVRDSGDAGRGVLSAKVQLFEGGNAQSATAMGGQKTRDFYFDYVLGPETSQDEIYDTIGGPVVDDVLRGYNGTVFAYGQTGTGKTYTMGILDRVTDENAGVIPRAFGHVFGHIAQASSAAAGSPGATAFAVHMSFLQVYLETVQDLLVPPESPHLLEENLPVREQPGRGFFV